MATEGSVVEGKERAGKTGERAESAEEVEDQGALRTGTEGIGEGTGGGVWGVGPGQFLLTMGGKRVGNYGCGETLPGRNAPCG